MLSISVLQPYNVAGIPCDPPESPRNGYMDPDGVTSHHFRSSVTFTCYHGYTLNGLATLWCEEGKQWSHSSPKCECEYHFCISLKKR